MEIKNKGITLIALIITIIIMLILAGIVISLTIGENGIIAKAQLARKSYIDATNAEKNELAKFDENHIENSREQITIDKQEYEQLKNDIEELKSKTASDWIEIENSNISVSAISTWYTKTFSKIIGANEVLIVFSDNTQCLIQNLNDKTVSFYYPGTHYSNANWRIIAYGNVNFSTGEVRYIINVKGSSTPSYTVSKIYYR